MARRTSNWKRKERWHRLMNYVILIVVRTLCILIAKRKEIYIYGLVGKMESLLNSILKIFILVQNSN